MKVIIAWNFGSPSGAFSGMGRFSPLRNELYDFHDFRIHLFPVFSQQLPLCQALVNSHCEYSPLRLKT